VRSIASKKRKTMENLKEIVRGTTAKLSHVCGGKAFYQIQTSQHLYQLEIDSMEKEWETTYLFPEFKTITLMRWIRKGMETSDGSFIQLN
jgi:predicted N-acyltransferase